MKLSTLKGHRFAIAAGILVASAACPDAMLMAIVDCHELAAPARTQGSEMMDHNATHDNFGVQDHDTLKPFEILLFELKGCVCTQSAQGIELQFIENCPCLRRCVPFTRLKVHIYSNGLFDDCLENEGSW